MLSFPVAGVVNDKLRTVRARRSGGAALFGTSRASLMIPGVCHRDGNLSILQAGVYMSGAITCGRASHLKPHAKKASRSVGHVTWNTSDRPNR
ncbi:uncharacterized protein AMSG_06804 [Thecamonas trahens ATCC 50062]|uniref:Uncharacterized protein n=1 Tax=Thecamonas trahens ATCC 50062 TaxID=461836 RepID=A0A0L0DD96_THETB|nr:hypothetical protein AMSG_06804 [Thecamonas trahens ATCC 50062]KNC50322.1 hypothetical protein AMSG_06804 [Thecamonas trahens ATCC 50062]|eukprot:XP_013756868.1 hypothetical protein AMSG_06804 [Thecamonas trahens ATCC 50062]